MRRGSGDDQICIAGGTRDVKEGDQGEGERAKKSSWPKDIDRGFCT
jgi:hypothetical protein